MAIGYFDANLSGKCDFRKATGEIKPFSFFLLDVSMAENSAQCMKNQKGTHAICQMNKSYNFYYTLAVGMSH